MGENALVAVTYSSKNHLGRKELWSQLQKLASGKGDQTETPV